MKKVIHYKPARYIWHVTSWLANQDTLVIAADRAEVEGYTAHFYREGLGRVATVHHCNTVEPRATDGTAYQSPYHPTLREADDD